MLFQITKEEAILAPSLIGEWDKLTTAILLHPWTTELKNYKGKSNKNGQIRRISQSLPWSMRGVGLLWNVMGDSTMHGDRLGFHMFTTRKKRGLGPRKQNRFI